MTAAMLEKECLGNTVTAISFALSLVIVATTTLNGKSKAPKKIHRSFNRSQIYIYFLMILKEASCNSLS